MKKQRKNVQDMKVKNRRNSNKGITLIALVITIIVLLILAGVSIATLTGENGIITRANDAKTETEKQSALEKVQVEVLGSFGNDGNLDGGLLKNNLNHITGITGVPETITASSFPITVTVDGYEIIIDNDGDVTVFELELVEAGERAKVTVKDNYTDGTKTATIPAGYTVSNIAGEKTIDGGLVIYEIPEGTTVDWTAKNADGVYEVQTLYNQFVWIPATERTYLRNETYANTNISTRAYTDKNYLPTRIQPTIDSSITDVEQIGTINETAERTAVKNAGGFYISRYEAGKETVDGVEKLVSKKGANVWVSISQETAKTTAKNANSNYALCSGIQWDVTMAFVNGKLDGDDKPQTFNVTTASGSRHIGGSSVAVSGQNEADRVANIYDLEGNAYEYVAEKNTYNSSRPYVYRGGNYGDTYSASNRDYGGGNAYTYSSFRFTLYAM